ncbi:MAG: alpha-amylase [Promethearchaeota archaeon]|nr:MAG: alpha-amylase [Candidatus Lokiarchaeota archaeon]
MKLSRDARQKYDLEEFEFNEKGNIEFNGDIYSVRLFVQKLNQKKDLINYPELAIKVAQFNGMALIWEINNDIIELYKQETDNDSLFKELYDHLSLKFGEKIVVETTKRLVENFPPDQILKNKVPIEDFLEEKAKNYENKVNYLNEFVNLWTANENPSFSPYLEFFDDASLEKKTEYTQIIEEIDSFFEAKPRFGPNNQNLFELLREPALEFPHSIREQLEYMSQNWGRLLGNNLYKILTALDLIREEEQFRGLGPGESLVYEYDQLEYENFTPDKEWMPKVVMIAKNVFVWLAQLSKKYQRSINTLDEIPNEELEQLKRWGFNAIWLIGVWERSQASKTIKQWCGNPEAEASAYSIYDYNIAYELGGYEALMNLKRRAWEYGIRLASDMVPNHMGIVSKWTIEHPEWFIALPYPPFPSYNYSGENLSGNLDIGIYIEDKYFTRSDAAVTFKRYDFRNGDERYIYHGNDGTSFPWNDTAQLNFLNPDVREKVIQMILHVSRLFPIIRFDAAMTLTRKHYQRLWFPEPGTGGAIPSRAEHGMPRAEFLEAFPHEFWREVVDRINDKNPDTLLLAEAFWLLEGFFVRTLGMHRVYNSAFMNMLRDEDNAKYRAVIRNTIEFDPKILKRFVNFMNNPDEETAIKQFGHGDKYFGICTLMVTMPGLPMFGHGQVEGYHEKYGMEYRKPYWNEEINQGLLQHHKDTIFPLLKKRYLFSEVKNFLIYDFWTGNYVNEDVFAYSNSINNERALVIYHNKYRETKGFIKSSVGFSVKIGDESIIIQKTLSEGLDLPPDAYCIFKDYVSGLEYIRRTNDLREKGFYIELKAYQRFVFMDFQIVYDNEFFHYAQLYDLLAGKGVYNIKETLQEMVFKPLIQPFKEIINPNTISELISYGNNARKLLRKIGKSLNKFLKEAKKYSASKGEITSIEAEILDKLHLIFNLNTVVQNIHVSSSLNKEISDFLPKNKFEKVVLICWVFVHNLGKLTDLRNYELRTRSLIDDWHLSKYLQIVLKSFNSGTDDEIAEKLSLIKILVKHQNIFSAISLSDNIEPSYIVVLMSDPEVQQFLNFNRFQDVLWFSAERVKMLMRWLFLITFLKSIDLKDELGLSKIDKTLRSIKKWLKIADQSGYQVQKFLELEKNSKLS